MTNRSTVVLDIGANVGAFGLEVAARNPETSVICVEPIPELADQIEASAAGRGLDNVLVIRAAVTSEPGASRTLNVSENGDWGVSSLMTFDDEHVHADEYWRIRPDLSFVRSITVDTLTLKDLIRQYGLDTIDFIKIDVQGLDVEVLLSAGDRLPLIQAGMLEVPTLPARSLYKDEQYSLGSAIAALDEHGFDVIDIQANDPALNEVNLYFTRAGANMADIEDRLSLHGVDIYDGKRFWAIPCSTVEELQQAQGRFSAADDVVSERTAEEIRGLYAQRHELTELLASAMRRCDEVTRQLEYQRFVRSEDDPRD